MKPARDVPRDFLDRLERSPKPILCLDYDGTLAPFTKDRNSAHPWEGVPETLTRIQAGVTEMVVVTGRDAADIPRFLKLDRPFEIIGCHGAQVMQKDGKIIATELPACAEEGLERAFSGALKNVPADRLERKSAGLALHWRGMNPEEAERLKQSIAVEWAIIAEESGLEVRPFDGGLELRVPGIDKGAAVARRLKNLSTDNAAAYLGDDETDEDAFRVMKGKGLSVLVRPEPGPTLASVWLRPPEELLGFLAVWARLTQQKE